MSRTPGFVDEVKKEENPSTVCWLELYTSSQQSETTSIVAFYGS
jgi:hypothetical protein